MIEENGRLRNLEAENYILNQRIATEWIYADDEWKKQARLFCVKGLAQIDLLKSIQAELAKAQQEGTGFQDFKKVLRGKLKAEGWLGGDEKTLSRRLDIIYKTNTASARAEAKWAKIQKTKEIMPYLQYLPSFSADKREEHKAFYGLVAKADDPIWKRIFPPNGYGCKCRVRQLTEEQALKIIKEQEENGGRITVSNEDINKAVDKSFQYSHENLSAVLGYMGQQIGAEATNFLTKELLKNQAQAEGLGDLVKLAKEGGKILKKHDEIIKNRLLVKPSQAVLKIIQAEGGNFGGFTPKVIAEKGAEEKAELVKKILQEVFLEDWIEESNNAGKIIVISPTSWKGEQKSFHFLCSTSEDFAFFKENYIGKGGFEAKEGDSIIALSETFDRATIIHEFAHRLQTLHSEIQNVLQSYYNIRTQNEPIKKMLESYKKLFPNKSLEQIKLLTLISEEELTKEDKFVFPYMGKIEEDVAEEIMPVSFELLLGDKDKGFLSNVFFEKEKELLKILVALLVKSGKRRKK